jgi:hypothetical protein
MPKFGALTLIFAIGVTSGPATRATSANPIAISVAIEIIRGAATLGLERAGSQVMGEAWPYFKLVLQPVIRRFPALLDFGTSQERAAQEASGALASDRGLREAILQRLATLEEGQEILAAKLRVFEAVLTDHERRLQALERDMGRGQPEEFVPLTPGSDKFSDFRRAVRMFIEQAGAPGFRDIKGAWLKPERSFESSVYLPAAEACRITDTDRGTWAYCRMFWDPPLSRKDRAPALSQAIYQETVQLVSFSVPPHWQKTQEHIVGQPTRSEKRPEGGLIIRPQTDVDLFLAAEPGQGRRVVVRLERILYLGTGHSVVVQFLPAGWSPLQ